jgi:hypothetical protein
MAYLQNQGADRTVYLTKVDVPATTVTYADITVKYKKNGQSVFTTKTVTPSEWVNLGNGIYTLRFTASEMDTTGDFLFTVEGPLFDNFIYDEFTIEPAPAGSGPAVLPGICVVSGAVRNVQNLNPQLLKIVFRPVEFPARYNMTMIAADAIVTFPDAYGNFSVQLIRGSVVIVEIERAGIRSQITVPDAASANLLDLLPPFAVDYGA